MFATFVLVMALPSVAWADGFQYLVRNQRSQSDGPGPVLVLQAEDAFRSGQVTVKLDGKTFTTSKFGALNPGATREIPLKVKEGSYSFDVDINAVAHDGAKIQFPITFKIVRVAPVQVKIDTDLVDLGKGELVLRTNRPLERVEMEIFDKQGNVATTHENQLNGRQGDVTISWPAREDLGAISLKAHDVDGFWVGVMLEPFFIEIPHEEIIFDFGKATWQAAEEPKLQKTLKAIQEAMVKYERFRPDMRLYIAGYTDTVGSAADNQRLSQERAEAIARWFRKNGVKFPLFAQGFGESVLLVATPDETPEPRNRRAVYVLGNSKPSPSKSFPTANWRRIQ
jgi:outer membrane protein OmpA-like peptidoglycan-associated protein